MHSGAVHRLPDAAGNRQHEGIALDGADGLVRAPTKIRLRLRLRLVVRHRLAAGSQRLPRDRLRDADDGADGRRRGGEDQDVGRCRQRGRDPGQRRCGHRPDDGDGGVVGSAEYVAVCVGMDVVCNINLVIVLLFGLLADDDVCMYVHY